VAQFVSAGATADTSPRCYPDRVQVLVLQMTPPRMQPCTVMVLAFCKVTLAL